MAAFSKYRGLFGAPMAADRAADGLSPVAVDAVTPTYKKPSTGKMILGVLGDTLQQFGGGTGTFLQGQNLQRKAVLDAQARQQEAAGKFAGFRQQYDYELAHPKQGQGTALQQNYEYLKTLDPAAAESYLRTQTTAPPIVQTNPDGTKTVYPAGLVPQGGAAPQRQILQQLPPGVKPLGGAPSAGARTFPIR